MPNWMRRYLRSRDLRAHFWTALALGALFRFFSAYFVYGPQALDDYKHGVWPAWQFWAGIPLDLPEYRSHLLVWLLSVFIEIGSWFGVSSALGQVRAMYMGLGALSLLGIYGTYLYVRRDRDPRFGLFAPLALYLIALFPLMPFVGTRAFGEAVALSLVVLSFGILEETRRTRSRQFLCWMVGFVILGIATLFRFHVGLLFFSYVGVLLVLHQWRGIAGAAVAGGLTLAAQAAVDIGSGKQAFETLRVYLAENAGGGAKYGVSPWYNPWLFVLGIALAPFAFVLFGHLRGLWRRRWPVLVPFLVFVAAHSVAAHKEERFLYPIIGLELWAVADLWACAALSRWARRIYAPVALFVGVLGLVVVSFVNTQEGEIEPPAYVESTYDSVVYLDYESLFGRSRFQFYFLRPPSVLEKMDDPGDFQAHRVDEALLSHPDHHAAVLLTSDPTAYVELRALEGVQTLAGRCLRVREAGSLIDRLLYKMNPKHNQRRRPTWYLVCERNSHAP